MGVIRFILAFGPRPPQPFASLWRARVYPGRLLQIAERLGNPTRDMVEGIPDFEW